MKHKYRGQLNNGKMVDIFDFDGDVAKCDHGIGNIHIDQFNCIFLPRDTFKDIMGIVTEVEFKEVKELPKKTRKKS